MSHKQEYEEFAGELSEVVQKSKDPVAVALMLYEIAEERKSTNLLVKDINAKFDKLFNQLGNLETLIEKLENISDQLSKINVPAEVAPAEDVHTALSDRDEEVLAFVKEKGQICAEDLQEAFGYKGRNAASARLSKLFRDNLVEKVFMGRNVYYRLKS